MGFLRKPSEQPSPLVAAAQEIHLADYGQSQEVWLARQVWQERVYGYYDEVGEVRFSTKFVGNAVSKIRLVAAEWPSGVPDDDETPIQTSDKAVKAAVSSLKSARGGQGGMLRSMAQNLFLVGEMWLVGYGPGNWEALSISELQIRPNEKVAYRKVLPALPPKQIDPDALLVRVWQEHPKYSQLADSAFRTVLGECEKLLLLSRADRAQARNRMAGRGLLFIPNELVPPSQQPNARTGQNQVTPGGNPLIDTFTQAAVSPIKDETHPSAVVPVILTGPGEQGNNIKYISFEATADRQASAKREEARASIAVAIDLPADVLTGKSDLNHWNAWLIREETFQQHLQPFVELICNALTVGYLQPALERAGVKNPEKFVIWYDDSRLVARPNRTEAADTGIQTPGGISFSAWRAEHGFNEDQAPSDLEYAQRVGIQLMDPKMAVTGEVPPEDPAKAGGQGQPIATKTTVSEQGPANGSQVKNPRGAIPKEVPKRGATTNKPNSAKTASPDKGGDGAKPTTASAAKPPRRTEAGARAGRALAQLDINLMQKIRVAADEVTQQAMSRAGARIRSKVKDKPSYQELLADVDNNHVAKALGPATLESLELAPGELVQDAYKGFGNRVDGWLRQAQQQRNKIIAGFAATLTSAQVISDDEIQADREAYWEDRLDREYGPQDHDDRGLAVALLLGGLTAFASDKLFNSDGSVDDLGESDSIDVPARTVRSAVEAAGGGGGVGVGTRSQEIFTDLGIDVAGWEWQYGPWERKTTFRAHLDLDGQQFSSMDDEALAVDERDAWLDREYYKPGDHFGCLCQKAPLLDDGTDNSDNSEES